MSGDKQQILQTATRFRVALDDLDRSLFPEHLRDFPHGCCSDVSDLLATYLHDIGLGDFDLISAERETASDSTVPFQTHAWLGQGNLIIDITADQFSENEESVIVHTSSTWHDTFRVSSSRSAGLQGIDGPIKRELNE